MSLKISNRIAACSMLAVVSPCLASSPVPASAIDRLQSGFFDQSLVIHWGPQATPAARADILASVQGSVIATSPLGSDIVRTDADLVAARMMLEAVEPTFITGVQDTDLFVNSQFDVSDFDLQSLTLAPLASGRVLVPVVLDGGLYTLELAPFSSRAANFRVMVDDGVNPLYEVAAPAPKTWRGRVVEMPGSVVAATIDGASLTASILLHDNVEDGWFIQPLDETLDNNPADLHVVYHGLASTVSGGECGGALPHAEFVNPIEPNNGSLRGTLPLIVEMAYDGDFQFYQLNGSNLNNTIADIENVQNGMITVYERDCNITFITTEIVVRTSSASNPYTTNNSSDLLGQFGTYWIQNHMAIHRDLAHLMTGRNMGGVLGIAWLGAACSVSNGYGVSRSRFTSNFAQRVALTAHEVGHNLNAPHCSGSTCKIMCAGLGGCGGIGLPNFSTASANIIINYANSRWCIDDGSPPPNEPPVVTITTPFPATVYAEGASILFSALATDPQDGNVAANLVWTSNLDGAIGNGAFFVSTTLSAGNHTITASVIDAGGLAGDDAVNITVEAAVEDCPADRNDDGLLDFFDIQNFLDALANENASADMNSDGNFDFFDVQQYLDLFSQGCP
jgi:hypothetical protein